MTEQRGFDHVFYRQHMLEPRFPNISKASLGSSILIRDIFFQRFPVDLSIYTTNNTSLLTRFWKYTFVRFSLSLKGDDVIGMLVFG